MSACGHLSGRFAGNEGDYEWDIVDSNAGTIHYSLNRGPYDETHFEHTTEEFQAELGKDAIKYATLARIKEILGRSVAPDEAPHYLRAWRALHAKDYAFFAFCIELIGKYHALDTALAQTFLLGIMRACYSSNSALVHFDCTGGSGAGKNDLISHVTPLIPPHRVELFSSITPKTLYYETLDWIDEGRGRTRPMVNKNRFRGKVVCISEAKDSETYSALKALSEVDKNLEYTHLAIINGESVRMTITGPRCVVIASVDGINDEQIKSRFIHASVSADTPDNVRLKLEVARRIMKERKDIQDDFLNPAARAGIDLVLSVEDAVFEPLELPVERLMERSTPPAVPRSQVPPYSPRRT